MRGRVIGLGLMLVKNIGLGDRPDCMGIIPKAWQVHSSSNSVGVAISQPRVAGEARYPGYIYNKV